MAIYQNSYGMTDRRKPEIKLTITSVEEEYAQIQQPHLTSPAAQDGSNQPLLQWAVQVGKPQQESWYEDSNQSSSEFL